MTTTRKKLARERERHNKEVARMEREIEIWEKVVTSDDWVPDHIYFHNGKNPYASLYWSDTYGRDPGFTLDDVREVVKLFPPLPSAWVRTGCLGWDALDVAQTKDGEITELAPFVIDAEVIRQGQYSIKMSWWSRVEGELLKISAPLDREVCHFEATYYTTRNNHRKHDGYRVNITGLPGAKITRFWSSDRKFKPNFRYTWKAGTEVL